MREGWKVRALGDLYDIGSSKRVHKHDWSDHGVPFYRAREIVKLARQGFVDNDLFITEELFEQHKSKTGAPSAGDLMVTAVGTLGICYVVNDRDRFYFKDASVLWFRPKGEVASRFMGYAFQAPQIREQTTDSAGATVGTLTISRAKALKIGLPPLPEQKRIVAILDEVFEGIDRAVANAEKNLANTRELFESYLNAIFFQMVDQVESFPLQELCDRDRVITYGVIKLGKEIPDGVPCLRTSNVRWLHIDAKGMRRIAPSLSMDYKRTILRGGEVLVNVRGTLGGVAVVTPEMVGWNVSREVAVAPADTNKVDPHYLAYWIGNKSSQQWLTGVLKGLAYIGINIADLRTLPVPLPAMNEQRHIVEKLDRLLKESRRLEVVYHKQLHSLAELKQSILQKAFTGELTAEPDKVIGAAVA